MEGGLSPRVIPGILPINYTRTRCGEVQERSERMALYAVNMVVVGYGRREQVCDSEDRGRGQGGNCEREKTRGTILRKQGGGPGGRGFRT